MSSAGLARPRPLAVVLAVLVVVGSCGGDGDEEGSRPAAAKREVTTTTTAATTSSSTSSTTAAVGGAGARRSAPAPGAPKPARSGGPTASAPSPFTAPGRYTYATSGTFSSLLTGSQLRTGESVLTVDPPAGRDQRTVRQGPDSAVEQVLRLQDDGAFLVHLGQATMGLRKDFRPEPPVLAVPLPPSVGRAWSWRITSTDGLTTVDAGLRVARTETVDVGGENVPVVVVEATITTGGDVVSTTRQTLWISDRYRLVVQQ